MTPFVELRLWNSLQEINEKKKPDEVCEITFGNEPTHLTSPFTQFFSSWLYRHRPQRRPICMPSWMFAPILQNFQAHIKFIGKISFGWNPGATQAFCWPPLLPHATTQILRMSECHIQPNLQSSVYNISLHLEAKQSWTWEMSCFMLYTVFTCAAALSFTCLAPRQPVLALLTRKVQYTIYCRMLKHLKSYLSGCDFGVFVAISKSQRQLLDRSYTLLTGSTILEIRWLSSIIIRFHHTSQRTHNSFQTFRWSDYVEVINKMDRSNRALGVGIHW